MEPPPRLWTSSKDVAKYGVLNDATIKQLQSLTMRIDQDDEAGMRVVRLVKGWSMESWAAF